MEIIYEHSDDEVYFDLKINSFDLEQIQQGHVVCKQIILSDQKYNFGVYQKEDEES